MHFAFVYLAHRAVFRAADFFRHWYIDTSRAFFHSFLSTLEAVDSRIAFRVTLRHFFEPLYQDYSIVGRILGFVFRSLRTVIGAICYVVIGILYASILAAWYVTPIILIFYAVQRF